MQMVTLDALRNQFASFEHARTARRAECARLAETSDSRTLAKLYLECRDWYQRADEACESVIDRAEFGVSLLRDILGEKPAPTPTPNLPGSDELLGKLDSMAASVRREAEELRLGAIAVHENTFVGGASQRIAEYEQLCRVDPRVAAIRAGMVILKSVAKEAVAGGVLPHLATETLRQIPFDRIGEVIKVATGLQKAFSKIPLVRSDGIVELEALTNGLVEQVYRTRFTENFIRYANKTTDDIVSWRLRPDQPTWSKPASAAIFIGRWKTRAKASTKTSRPAVRSRAAARRRRRRRRSPGRWPARRSGNRRRRAGASANCPDCGAP